MQSVEATGYVPENESPTKVRLRLEKENHRFDAHIEVVSIRCCYKYLTAFGAAEKPLTILTILTCLKPADPQSRNKIVSLRNHVNADN